MRRILVPVIGLLLVVPGGAAAETEISTYYVPTVGGAHLRVIVARDPSLDPQPILLTYSPYYGSIFGSAAPPTDWFSQRYVPRGIARAWADVIGTNGSSGCWDYGGRVEQQSGVDLVNHLSALPWSTGKVAMIGLSYDGTTANMVAVRGGDVPGLAGIVPIAAISRWYEYSYYQGVRYSSFGTPPLFDFVIGRHLGPDHPVNDERGREATLARLGECGAIEHNVRAHEDSPRYDDFWLQRDYLKDAAKIRVPVLLAHGWQDYNVKQQQGLQMYEAIREDDPSTHAVDGAPFKLLYMFQGAHQFPAGDDWWPLLDAFLDKTLFGVDNGIEDGPASITQTTGRNGDPFRVEAEWPPPETTDVTLYLRDGGTLALEGGTDPVAVYSDVEHRTGRNVLDRVHRDRLQYVSPPLARDTRIAGSAILDAVLSVASVRGQLDVVLYDRDPEGTLARVAPGMMSLQYRNGLAAPELIPVGQQIGASVVVKPQDYTFAAGHSIAITVQPFVPEAVRDVPTQYTLHQGVSTLRLPVVDAGPGRLFVR